MKLRDYRKKNKISMERMAGLLMVNVSTICRYESGLRFPGRDMLKLIAKVTKSQVLASDFVGPQ